MATPDYNQWIDRAWGWPSENLAAIGFFAGASNIVLGTNPPYSALDFTAIYPKFLGVPVTFSGVTDGTTPAVLGISTVGTLVPYRLIAGPGIKPGTFIESVNVGTLSPTGNVQAGSKIITGVSSIAGLFPGQLISSGGAIPAGATIDSASGSQIVLSVAATVDAGSAVLTVPTVGLTLSQATTAAGTATLSAYTAALVPLPVLNAFIYLASSSLVQKRWQELWTMGMGLYIAHFLTLWLQSDGSPASTAAQAASQGLATGILVSESADGLSASFQAVQGLEDWGAYNLTSYGVQFATFARGVGAGPMLLW